MSETPNWETVREAIRLIKESWPEATVWAELENVERLLPADPAVFGSSLPESARAPVDELLRRIEPMVVLRPFARCGELADWVGFKLNA